MSPIRFKAFSHLTLGAALFVALTTSGCAVMDAIESQNAKWLQQDMAAFPDQPLMSTFVAADGTAAPGYVCAPCRFYFKEAADPLHFLTVDREGPRVHDTAALVAQNAASPIERSDAGLLFINNARARGNTVAVYGAPVNQKILALSGAKAPGLDGAWYATNASSCLVEVDRSGAFVSILGVGYQLSYGVIRTNVETSRDVFTRQRLFLLPQPTARFIQERLGSEFRENYRIR
ncbi:hypothetical protein [Solimonas sp. SE-A11]|uniref:hypothetical protein n=1 Tax=Solimonas sp. SE-A11 TaxID=3054954 RepID=UPI00259CE2B1|nr:hypothetical protein [Solimonas sp. SE-A11]MDM4772951.1 hypothetical protein [Solimonas sp. SE-A11]